MTGTAAAAAEGPPAAGAGAAETAKPGAAGWKDPYPHWDAKSLKARYVSALRRPLVQEPSKLSM